MQKTAVALAVLALGGVASNSAEAACNLAGATFWNFAGTGDWTTAADWTPNSVPNSTGTDVCITNGTGVVTLTTSQSVGKLQIGAGNGLNITTGTLYSGGSIQNDGAFTNSSFMVLANDVTLSGTGALTLSGGQIGTNGTAFTLTNQSTIQGSGVIGSNVGADYQNLGFSNSGTVNANASGGTLSIQGTGGTIINSGVLEAHGRRHAQHLALGRCRPTRAETIRGRRRARSTWSLGSQQMIQGGTLTTANGGILQTVGAAGP